MAEFVAIVDANNFPVYFTQNQPYSPETSHFQFLAEMALDFVDSQLIKATTAYSLLLVHDGVAIYGHMSNTNIKALLGVNAHVAADLDIERVLKGLQDLYIRHICNPFFDDAKRVTSVKFDAKVHDLVWPRQADVEAVTSGLEDLDTRNSGEAAEAAEMTVAGS